jgi:hypothetical protein
VLGCRGEGVAACLCMYVGVGVCVGVGVGVGVEFARMIWVLYGARTSFSAGAFCIHPQITLKTT